MANLKHHTGNRSEVYAQHLTAETHYPYKMASTATTWEWRHCQLIMH